MNALPALVRLFSLRDLGRRKLRYFFAALSVVLAVALVVSMRVSEVTILSSFEKSAAALAGAADVIVTRGTGVDHGALEKLDRIKGIKAAAVIEESTFSPDLGVSVTVLGVDFRRDSQLRSYKFAELSEVDPAALMLAANSVVVTRSLATNHRLGLRSTFKLQTPLGARAFRVAGILDHAGVGQAMLGQLVLTSIDNAQRNFGREGRYDRIEVDLQGTPIQALTDALGPDYQVRPIPRVDPVLSYILPQQRMILFAVTVMATLIALFIVYNLLSLVVVQRTAEIGILRAVGVTRGEIVLVLLVEAAIVGLAASGAGLLLGISLSRLIVEQTAQQINILKALIDIRELVIPGDILPLALLSGTAMTCVGAMVPAFAAAALPPMEALSRSRYEKRRLRGVWASFLCGLAILLGSQALAALNAHAGGYTGALSLIMAVSGFCLMLPQLIAWISVAVRRFSGRVIGVTVFLAIDNVIKFPSRTGLTVIAFTGSLAIIVAISGVRVAFEESISRWLDAIFPFDLTVQSHAITSPAYAAGMLSASLIEEAKANARVARAYGVRTSFAPYRNDMVMVWAGDMQEFMELRLQRGLYEDPALARQFVENMRSGGIAVSRNFANLHGSAEGMEIELPTASGQRRFRIVGTFEDYSWARGVVFLDRSVYAKEWKDDALTYLDIAASGGTDIKELRNDLARRFQDDFKLFIYETAEIKEHILGLVREWFRIADAQLLIALIIGSFGVVNTLLISVITQSRQRGLLRAIGATRLQIGAAFAMEGAYIGVLSGLFGSILGLLVLKFHLTAMAMQESGYDLGFEVPTATILVLLAAAPVIGGLSSFVPTWLIRKENTANQLAYD